jgi:hypothetical protein
MKNEGLGDCHHKPLLPWNLGHPFPSALCYMYTVWVENFEAINFHCFRGVSLDPRKLNPTNFDLAVQLLSHDTFKYFKPATLSQ